MVQKANTQSFVQKLSIQINQRTSRERALMLAVGIAFVYVIWSVVFHQAVVKERQNIQKQTETLQKKLSETRAQISVISQADLQGKASKDLQKKQQLTEQIRQVDEEFKKWADQLLSSENVSLFLEKVIRGEQGLKVIQLQSLPVESMLGATEGAAPKDKQQAPEPSSMQVASVVLYKHPILLELEGGYLDTVSFLGKMEKLTWRVFWDELNYEVKKYPTARITLKFHTLSKQKGRIEIK